MKKTFLRSLVVGLFAVFSLNASAAINYDYLLSRFCCDNLGCEYFGGYLWMEANSEVTFAIKVNNCTTGGMARVVWGPGYNYSGFHEGDHFIFDALTDNGGVDILYQGTNSVLQTLVPVDSEGYFYLTLYAGPTSGHRYFGPVYSWSQDVENIIEYFSGPLDWSIVYGWAPYPY